MKRPVLAALVVAMSTVALSSPSYARHHHRHHHHRYASHHDSRPRAWCGWWMRQQEGVSDRAYNLAANWRRYGSAAAAPAIGTIVVFRGGHHVGKITGGTPGHWIVTSGNDGHAVRSRERSVRGATFRWPPRIIIDHGMMLAAR